MRQFRFQPPDPSCSSRHLVYNANRFSLDLRLDFSSEGELTVTGQIVEQEGVPLPRVPAFLIASDQLLARSMSGCLGEFRMTCKPTDNLRLCLSLDDQQLVEVPVDRRRGVAPRRPLLIDSLFDEGNLSTGQRNSLSA